MKPNYNAKLQSVFTDVAQFYWCVRHSFTDVCQTVEWHVRQFYWNVSFTAIAIWKLNNAHLYFQSQEWGAGAMSSTKSTYALQWLHLKTVLEQSEGNFHCYCVCRGLNLSNLKKISLLLRLLNSVLCTSGFTWVKGMYTKSTVRSRYINATQATRERVQTYKMQLLPFQHHGDLENRSVIN